MLVIPNNKLSNHYRKKKVEKTIWLEESTVSSSFKQNLETMKDKTNIGVFYEDYLNPVFSFSDNFYPNLVGLCRCNMVSSYFSVFSNDELTNLEEYGLSLNPIRWDTDGDSLPDGYETYYGLKPGVGTGVDGVGDFDGDGLSNLEEYEYGITSGYTAQSKLFNGKNLCYLPKGIYWNGCNPVLVDSDADGISDGDEYYAITGYDTDPLKIDSDTDGLSDGIEINGWQIFIVRTDGSKETKTVYGNPLSSVDRDSDGLDDYSEFVNCTNPESSDTDGDGIPNTDDPDDDNDDLLDAWEINGYDNNNDGIIDVDLPGYGANPLIPDIFIEVDWMTGHEPVSDEEAEENVARVISLMFSGVLGCVWEYLIDGPIAHWLAERLMEWFNWYGTFTTVKNLFAAHGINIHIDDGNMGGGGEIAYQEKFPESWEDYYSSKFTSERHRVFHYCVIANLNHEGYWFVGGQGGCPGYSGWTNMFVIYDGAPLLDQTSTFLHELGHNLLGLIDSDHRSTSYFDNAKETHCNGIACIMFWTNMSKRLLFTLLGRINQGRCWFGAVIILVEE